MGRIHDECALITLLVVAALITVTICGYLGGLAVPAIQDWYKRRPAALAISSRTVQQCTPAAGLGANK